MAKRTTIEIDEQLLERAKRALGSPTTRATVEVALRRAAQSAEDGREAPTARQRRYVEVLEERLNLDVLASDEGWR